MTLENLTQLQTRRRLLQNCAGGLGSIALWHLLAGDGRAETPGVGTEASKAPHFKPTARNVIFLFMAGGPSHLDLFDPKPEMKRWEGQTLPPTMAQGLKLAFISPRAKIWPSPRIFARHGEAGTEISDYLPHLATVVDDISVVRSMFTEQVNHQPAELFLSSGSQLGGRPSMGAWVTYGLGSESQSLPGFVVLSSGGGSTAGPGNWSNGFLPASYQGVPFRSGRDPVLYLSNPPAISREDQRDTLDTLGDLNRQHYQDTGDLEITSRIASYELAFRMQAEAPGLLDISKESQSTLEMYGVNNDLMKPFATNCLLARRMVERGVRFVQVFHKGWDNHTELNKSLKKQCDITDQPTAALLKDLKQRGLLENTLVVWGGEFGRTPMAEERGSDRGRDHHARAFSMWLAGGGIKGGQALGTTDELGFQIIDDKVHVHDLHATMLHCLGLDHRRLTFRYQGRDFRLTDVAGNVVRKLLA